MNIISSFSFTEDKKPIIEEFKKIAQREGRSKSELAMDLIEQYVKNHSAGNSTFKIDDFQDPNFKAMPATMSSQEKWSKFIREHTNKEERMELDKIIKYIISEIEAKNWLDSRK